MTTPAAPPYDPSKITIAMAALYVAPSYTPMPADSSTLWDPTNWTGKTLTLGGATGITFSVTTAAGTQTTSSVTTLTAAGIQAALEALSNVGVGKVTVTGSAGGPFTVVFANTLGAVTLAITTSTGGAPTLTGGLWTPAGASEAGWTFAASRQVQTITIEEQSTPVAQLVTTTTAAISGNASEAGMQQVQWSLNALKTLIAQGVAQPAVTVLTMADDLVHYAVALETRNHQGYARRYYIPDAVAADGLTTAFRRNATQQLVPLSFGAVCAPNLIQVRSVTAPGL